MNAAFRFEATHDIAMTVIDIDVPHLGSALQDVLRRCDCFAHRRPIALLRCEVGMRSPLLQQAVDRDGRHGSTPTLGQVVQHSRGLTQKRRAGTDGGGIPGPVVVGCSQMRREKPLQPRGVDFHVRE